MNSLVVTLILVAISLVVIVPIYIIGVVVLFAMAGAGQGSGPNGPPEVDPAIILFFFFGMIFLVLIASAIIYIPFMFAYQLVADKKIGGGQACSMSFKASLKNLPGILLFMLVTTIISVLAAMCCYFPAFLFMPISFGALWILYRDVFGGEVAESCPSI